jgi:8-oxo-dGTP diphosphatase
MEVHTYGGRIRVRVSGLLEKDGSVLLVEVHSPVAGERIWTPPGGGLEFGESLEACLRREYREETGLEIEVQGLRFINELLEPPFHALEFYFEVQQTGGILQLGADPEHDMHQQYLHDIGWIPIEKLNEVRLAPPGLRSLLAGSRHKLQEHIVFSSFAK